MNSGPVPDNAGQEGQTLNSDASMYPWHPGSKPLENVLKRRLWGPIPSVSDSVGLRITFSNQLPDGAGAVGPGNPF